MIYFEVEGDLRILKLTKQVWEVEKMKVLEKIHKGINKLQDNRNFN